MKHSFHEQTGLMLLQAIKDDDPANVAKALAEGASWCKKIDAKRGQLDDGASSYWFSSAISPVDFCLLSGARKALFELLRWASERQELVLPDREFKAQRSGEMQNAGLLGRIDALEWMAKAGYEPPSAKCAEALLDALGRSAGRKLKTAWAGDEGKTNQEALEPAIEWMAKNGLAMPIPPQETAWGCEVSNWLMVARTGRVAKAFLDAGADPNALGRSGHSPLAKACLAGRKDWVRELVLGGADMFCCATDPKTGAMLNIEEFCAKACRTESAVAAVGAAREAYELVCSGAGQGPAPAKRRL